MAQPTSDESDALARLDRVHGPGGMKAALLAVLLVPDQPGRLRAWREETSLVGEAETIREDVERLGAAVRLPWFELLLARLGGTPLHDRQGLLRSARRVLTAAHPGLPIDRLLWLAMRRHFGENPYALVHAPAEAEIAQLPSADMRHVADYTAHLARMVRTSVAAPALGRIRSTRHCSITVASRPRSNATRSCSAPAKSSSPCIARSVISATSGFTPA